MASASAPTTTSTVPAATPTAAVSAVVTTAPAPTPAEVERIVVAPIVGVPVIVVGIAGIRPVVSGAWGGVSPALAVGEEVGAGFKGVKLERTDVWAVVDYGVVLLYFERLCLGVGAGIAPGFTLQSTGGVGVSVEGVEAVLD